MTKVSIDSISFCGPENSLELSDDHLGGKGFDDIFFSTDESPHRCALADAQQAPSRVRRRSSPGKRACH